MSAAVLNVTVGAHTYEASLNPSANKDAMAQVIGYTKTVNGGFRTLQFAEKVTKVAAQILKDLGSEFSSIFKETGDKLGAVTSGMGLLRLPEVTKDAVRVVSEPKGDLRSNVELVNKVADAASAWTYAGLFFTGNPALADAAKVTDAASSVTSLALDMEDYQLVNRHLEIIRTASTRIPEVEQRYADALQGAFITLVKDVCSAASAVLGLMALVLGGPLLPALVLMGIGLVSTTAAIASHFFKETRPYLKVDVDALRQVVI
jgi:hypothetical protein